MGAIWGFNVELGMLYSEVLDVALLFLDVAGTTKLYLCCVAACMCQPIAPMLGLSAYVAMLPWLAMPVVLLSIRPCVRHLHTAFALSQGRWFAMAWNPS